MFVGEEREVLSTAVTAETCGWFVRLNTAFSAVALEMYVLQRSETHDGQYIVLHVGGKDNEEIFISRERLQEFFRKYPELEDILEKRKVTKFVIMVEGKWYDE